MECVGVAGTEGGPQAKGHKASGRPPSWRKARTADGMLGPAQVGKDHWSRPGVTGGHSSWHSIR